METKAQRTTAQKNLIKDIVKRDCSHPTAETIYVQARENMPSISLGTVYRILNEMVDLGEARLVAVPGGKARYDHTAVPHAHLVCRCCGAVVDVTLPNYGFDVQTAVIGDINGHLVEDAQLMLNGICAACRGGKQ